MCVEKTPCMYYVSYHIPLYVVHIIYTTDNNIIYYNILFTYYAIHDTQMIITTTRCYKHIIIITILYIIIRVISAMYLSYAIRTYATLKLMFMHYVRHNTWVVVCWYLSCICIIMYCIRNAFEPNRTKRNKYGFTSTEIENSGISPRAFGFGPLQYTHYYNIILYLYAVVLWHAQYPRCNTRACFEVTVLQPDWLTARLYEIIII